jgi:hypothetical protein
MPRRDTLMHRLISLTVMLISSCCITFLEVMLLFTFLKLSLQHFVLLHKGRQTGSMLFLVRYKREAEMYKIVYF